MMAGGSEEVRCKSCHEWTRRWYALEDDAYLCWDCYDMDWHILIQPLLEDPETPEELNFDD